MNELMHELINFWPAYNTFVFRTGAMFLKS